MKVSTNWLRDYIAITGSVEQVAERLTMAGLEVKKVETCEHPKDILFEVEITTNRPDWLSHYGVAREIAAVQGGSLKAIPVKNITRGAIPPDWKVSIEEKQGCPFYTAVLIEGIEPAETPTYMKDRLLACGIRPISLIVDITNYVLLETGQPLHAFDAHCLNQKKIVVRRAKNKEKFIAINGNQLELTDQDLVIADSKEPVALAGIMGGKTTEIQFQTRDVLLESAFFHPAWIRRTSKRHSLASDSSYRFERRVDPLGVEFASRRAVSLIAELARPKKISKVIKAGRMDEKSQTIRFSLDEICEQIGASIKPSDALRMFRSLGLTVGAKSKSFWSVSVPSFRPDLMRPVDLAEEVARLYGYNRIPETVPQMVPQTQAPSPLFDLERQSRSFLSTLGFYESVTFSLVSEKGMDPAVDLVNAVSVNNPQNRELVWMRPVLWPSLLNVIQKNMYHGARTVPIFEIANVYYRNGAKSKPEQRKVVGLALYGERIQKSWMDPVRNAAYYDLKGCVEVFLEFAGLNDCQFEAVEKPFFSIEGSVAIMSHKKEIGMMGKIAAKSALQWDLDQPVYFAELNLETILAVRSGRPLLQDIPKYPAIERDLSVVVPESVKSGEIEMEIYGLGKGLIRKIELFDFFKGGRIPSGHKNLAYRITYQSLEKTLVSEDIQKLHTDIAEAVAKRFQASFQ